MSKRECKSYRTLISAYLDGDCDPDEEDRLFAHLATCFECQAVLDSYQEMRAGLRELPRVAPPPQLAREIRRVTVERPPARFWGRLFGMSGLRWGLSTVGALAIVVVGLTLVMVHGYNATLDPSITSSAPATQQEWPTTQPIRIEFSKAMDHTSVESSLRISPPGERDRLPLSWAGNALVIGADGTHSVTLLPDTDYTIVVLADARDQNGNPLGSVWTLRFHTGHSTSVLAQAPAATQTPAGTQAPTEPAAAKPTASATQPTPASSEATEPPNGALTATVPPVTLVPPSMVVTPPTSKSTQTAPAAAQTQPPATTAARQQTPTPAPTAVPTRASQPTPTPEPAATATAPPTPVPAQTPAPAPPTPEPTAVPTQAPQPTQAPATTAPAQTTTPNSVPVVGALGSVYWSHSDVQAKLGAPTAAEVKVNTAELSFQHGVMYERYDTDKIYILLNGGQWSEAADTWAAGDPAGGAACGSPSDNLFQPTKGFFKIWDADAKLQAALGCAVQQTTTLAADNVQRFANGMMLYGDQGFVYVVYDDGTWAVYPDTSGHGTLLTPTPSSGETTPPATVAPQSTVAPQTTATSTSTP